MRDRLVALDLETTGLNPDSDRIIEIGAVKFQGDRILEEYQTLVDPGLAIPSRTTQLTGIRDEDVADAPTLAKVLPGLRRFIGNAPLVGHNIMFDVTFLRNSGLPLKNGHIDTYSLASTLIPDAPGYSLSALIQYVGITVEDAHRALEDARMAAYLYMALDELAEKLPFETLEDIALAGERLRWGGGRYFAAIYEERLNNGERRRPGHRVYFTAADDWMDAAYLEPPGTTIPVPEDEVAALLEPGGLLAEAHEGYEYRPQQVDMLRLVTRSLNEGRHLMVEAPTGVGKSLAYLIPAAHFALANNDRVVISTNTINLQEQLSRKDIPFLQGLLKQPFRGAVLKGRANYLCPRRLEATRRRGPTSPLEMLVFAKTLVWLTQSRTGDRTELNLRGAAEAGIWSRLSAAAEGCTTSRCEAQTGGACPFYQARRRAETAHIVVVNHALLLSDAASDGRVLPDYSVLIVDEAHHLEDAVTNSLAYRVDPNVIKRQLADLGTENTGLLGDLLVSCRGALPEGHYQSLSEFVQAVVKAVKMTDTHVENYFTTLKDVLARTTNIRPGQYNQPVRINARTRGTPAWHEVEQRWESLSSYTSTIADGMSKLSRAMADFEADIDGIGDLVIGLASSARHMEELHTRLGEVTRDPAENTIYWAEFPSDGGAISVHTAPLDVGPMVSTELWAKRRAVVLASATLRTNESFTYMQDRLGAEEADTVALESPFDYRENAMLYIASDVPEPRAGAAYQRMVEQSVLDLSLALKGRVLVLFTSYSQLRQTAEAVGDQLAEAGIMLYDQGDGMSRTQLLDSFVSAERSVLMGTRSFWEGVDVPGEDLSALVIVRLPFAVPTDPVYASRSERYPNPFVDYGVQEAIIRFRQGFGRLIRTASDRGIVAILDSRVVSKRYGQYFLNSLPECTVRRGPAADLPETALAWLGEGP